MILYYTDSYLYGYNKLPILVCKHINNFENYLTTSEYFEEVMYKFCHSNEYLKYTKFGDNTVDIPIIDEIDFSGYHRNTGGGMKVWSLIEQISPTESVKLSGIKFDRSNIGYPLMISLCNNSPNYLDFFGTVQKDHYCQNTIDFWSEVSIKDTPWSTHRGSTILSIKDVYVLLIVSLLEKLFAFYHITLPKNHRYIISNFINLGLNNHSAYLGDNVIDKYLYDSMFDNKGKPILNRAEYLDVAAYSHLSGISNTSLDADTLEEVLCLLIKELFIFKMINSMSGNFLLAHNSELFNMVRYGNIRVNLDNIISMAGVVTLPPENFIGYTNKINCIKGDYLLTPDICSSINNFNLYKYGSMFHNLNSLVVVTPETRLFINKTNLLINNWGIFNIVLNIDVYKLGLDSRYIFDVDLSLIEDYVREIQELVYIFFRVETVYYIQITKTFMGDVVMTMFDEMEMFICGLYYNEIMDSLNTQS